MYKYFPGAGVPDQEMHHDMESDYSTKSRYVFGLCDKAHYHHMVTSGPNAPLLPLPESLQMNAFELTFETKAPISSKIYYIKRCPCDVQMDMDYSINSRDLVFGLCDKAHYHNIVSSGSSAPVSPLPESLHVDAFDVTYRTEVPINSKIFYIKKCPGNVRSLSIGTTSFQSESVCSNGTGDQASSIHKAITDALEKKLFISIQKKQDELLSNFKKETDSVIKDFKALYKDLNWEMSSISRSVAANCAQLQKFGEQVEELEVKIQELLPETSSDSDESSTESEESEDILQEIDAIKQSDRTFMDYRPLTGQCWEVKKPVSFEVTICDTTLYAVYDPRVAKSVMSDDILFSDDEIEELDFDKVFYVPWWFPKLQTCRDEGTVDVLINTYYSHTLNVAINPFWNKTIVLGFNFGQKFIDDVNEDNMIIKLRDDAGSCYDVNFEYYF